MTRLPGWIQRNRTGLIAVGSVLGIVAVVVLAVAYVFFGAFHANRAEDAVAPLEQRLQAVGGQKVCSSGFNGYGELADATTPWYFVTYRVPNAATAKKVFFDEARKRGYVLAQRTVDYGGPLDQVFDSGQPDGSGLGLDIQRNTKVSDVCDSGGDGAVSGEQALFTVTAPEVHR